MMLTLTSCFLALNICIIVFSVCHSFVFLLTIFVCNERLSGPYFAAVADYPVHDGEFQLQFICVIIRFVSLTNERFRSLVLEKALFEFIEFLLPNIFFDEGRRCFYSTDALCS